MTDKELLAICHTAFEAFPTARDARILLAKIPNEHVGFEGNNRDRLAAAMARMIDEHLQGASDGKDRSRNAQNENSVDAT